MKKMRVGSPDHWFSTYGPQTSGGLAYDLLAYKIALLGTFSFVHDLRK